jgi:GNAT superfamily N-acetyltransferase
MNRTKVPNCKVVRCNETHIDALSQIGSETFIDTYRDHFDRDFSLEALDTYVNTTFSGKKILNDLKNPNVIYFLVTVNDDPKCVAYAKLVSMEPSIQLEIRPTLNLQQIYVVSQYKNFGVGTIFLKHIEQYAVSKKFKALWLGTWDDNRAAIEFYSRKGYKVFGNEPFLISGTNFQDTDLLMFKSLD